MKYKQCLLKSETANAEVVTIGWIEERGAKVGVFVEVKEFDNQLFQVAEVYEPAIEAYAMRKKQEANRNPFASLMAEKKL